MSQMIVKCVTCSGTGMREENDGRITTCDFCGGNDAKSISTERGTLPTPKQSDMERALRGCLTQEENNLLTIELQNVQRFRDGHIAMLVASKLRERAG